jgi:undecaprenyl diphosphate synthase
MRLFEQYFDKLVEDVVKDKVRLVHLGRKDRIPEGLAKKITSLEERTREFSEYTLNIALDYGGRDEILRAIQKSNQELGIKNQELSENDFEQFLDTGDQPYPNPDLIIRTSGEMRTSGLFPWQSIYAEYLFLDKYFPDLSEEDIDLAIENFSNRQRRFGK